METNQKGKVLVTYKNDKHEYVELNSEMEEALAGLEKIKEDIIKLKLLRNELQESLKQSEKNMVAELLKTKQFNLNGKSKSKRLNLYIQPETLEDIRIAANLMNISINEMVNILLEDRLTAIRNIPSFINAKNELIEKE